MDSVTEYPVFSALSLDTVQALRNRLLQLPDGISDFSFGNLYCFKDMYQYQVCSYNGQIFIFSGMYNGESFFFTPFGIPPATIIQELLEQYTTWKFISQSCIQDNTAFFEQLKGVLKEDRDNFDYMYTRVALSSLSGKKMHKKKNHVNAFLQKYPDFSVKPLHTTNRKDAYAVLDFWHKEQKANAAADYQAACYALDCLELSNFFGCMLYVANIPVAWCLAELIDRGRTAVVHFEKARTDFHGSYQYINYAFAQSLPESVEYINREQDLGDSGLRKAKMSYHPEYFIKKYSLTKGVAVQICS